MTSALTFCCFGLSEAQDTKPQRWDYGDIRHYYAYDTSLPLEASVESKQTFNQKTKIVVKMRAADGSWFRAALFVPTKDGPYGLFLGEANAAGSVDSLVAAGYLCADIEKRLSGQRSKDGLSMDMGKDLMIAVWSRQHTGIDYRRLRQTDPGSDSTIVLRRLTSIG